MKKTIAESGGILVTGLVLLFIFAVPALGWEYCPICKYWSTSLNECVNKADGTDCGDCKECSGGSCQSTCDSSQVCCNDSCCSNACCGGQCCGSGQTCCNDSCCSNECCNNVCCASGQECCGDECCDPEDCCGGECCDNVCCNDVCCEAGQTCCNGSCCDPVDCCNNDICCNSGDVCCTDSGSYCCPSGETCCEGNCCESGTTCCDGMCCRDGPDGCSTPTGDNPTLCTNTSFGDCCNSHDDCYWTCSSDKGQCDVAFSDCMTNVCDSLEGDEWVVCFAPCTAWRLVYWVAVELVGQGAYDAAQDCACCLNP